MTIPVCFPVKDWGGILNVILAVLIVWQLVVLPITLTLIKGAHPREELAVEVG